MAFEIEKKFLVNNYKDTLSFFKERYGEPNLVKKAGFWWCNNNSGDKNILEIKDTKFLKKDVERIKDLTEFLFIIQDYQYLRIRIIDKNRYYLTLKNKNIINNIEKNVEYEFEIDSDTLKSVIDYLKDNAFIFYYNIKETFEFKNKKDDIKIELSKFNILKDYYLEIEVTGENENMLYEKLNKYLNKELDCLSLKNETRNYFELSLLENRDKLKNVKLSTFSKESFKNLLTLLSN